jgi:hypothetical protein
MRPNRQAMRIAARYNGPPNSANGGYTCGLLARGMSGAVEVTLRLPPPLDRELELREHKLYDGDRLVAEARESELELPVPTPPPISQARQAGEHYFGLHDHPFPTCFVCGSARAAGDGLRVFAGPLPGRDLVAAVWTPSADLGDSKGQVRSEFLWCALDCPGAWSLDQKMESPHVLGRLTAQLEGPLPVMQPAIVIGWPLGKEGRKAFAGTAVFTASGDLVARAKAVWIAVSA